MLIRQMCTGLSVPPHAPARHMLTYATMQLLPGSINLQWKPADLRRSKILYTISRSPRSCALISSPLNSIKTSTASTVSWFFIITFGSWEQVLPSRHITILIPRRERHTIWQSSLQITTMAQFIGHGAVSVTKMAWRKVYRKFPSQKIVELSTILVTANNEMRDITKFLKGCSSVSQGKHDEQMKLRSRFQR